MTKEKQCPFGIKARFCKYQKTYAKDTLSAIEGNLLFICALDKVDDCLEIDRIVNGETRPPYSPRIRHT